MKKRINKNTMMMEIELYDEDGDEFEIELPAKFEVCYGCRGKGTHVHRGVDGHGITASEFAEDPDFAEAYWSGVYDVICEDCHGEKVIAAIDYETIEKGRNQQWKDDLELYEEQCRADYHFDRIAAAERAFGC